MPLVSPREMFEHASKNNYGLGAFNVFSIETLIAVLEAAQNQNSPVIVQVTIYARGYVRHLAEFVTLVKAYADKCSAPVMVQHDHCATLEDCRIAIESGVQGLMFDGSHLALEKNIAETAKVAEYAHKHGVWVEAELGRLPGREDTAFSESAIYTDPGLVGDFIRRSGCDALAIAVGTSHWGVEGDDYLPFRFELLQKIAGMNPGFPLVLHGGASLPPELIDACNAEGGRVPYFRNCREDDIARAVGLGVRKVNMDVDNFLCFTTAIRHFFNHSPEMYDPRKYLADGLEAFRGEVEHKMKNVMKSAGHAW